MAAEPRTGVSTVAPDFELPDQHGTPTALAELRAAGLVVLVFYPFAHTGVCTGELRELQDALPELAERGARPVAISCDSMFTQRVFAETEGFGFTMLSDFWPHGATAQAYGIFDADRGCALRGTFVVDREGRIGWSVVNRLPDARNLPDLFAALDATGRD